MKMLLIFVLLIIACQDQTDSTVTMDFSNMEQLNDNDSVATLLFKKADAEMKKNGYNLAKLDKEIKADDKNYYVVYTLNDLAVLGGGGVIAYKKGTLEMIGKKLEE